MILLPTFENVLLGIQALKEQELIGLPTETVYGLAADATQDLAVARIFEKKNRPTFNPLIIHGPSHDAFKEHVIWNDRAEVLARTFWPGPLTLVLPRLPSSTLSLLVSAGLPSLAIRIPNHPVALTLLQEFEGLIAAPSANLSGKISPTEANHVEEDFPGLMIFDGGSAAIGVESTIVDLTGPSTVLLRPGGVTRDELEATIGFVEITPSNLIKAPGMMKSHYAPTLPLRLNAAKPLKNEAYLAFGLTHYEGDNVLNLSSKGSLTEAASNFFKMLRLLDKSSFERIAVAPLPFTGLGVALNDRLKRAAAPLET